MATTAATGTTKSVAAPGGSRRSTTRPRGAWWPLAVVVLPLGVAAAGRGGFGPGSQVLFAGLAAVALATALNLDEARSLASLRSSVCLLLLGLGALGVASALWTVGDGAAAVRWGLVAGGYGALCAATATALWSRAALNWLLAGICVLAGAEALIGLAAAGLRVEPFAERIEGSWRPGGSFEYAPALALLQIAALPALLRGMCRGPAKVALIAALGAALAGAAVALAASRLELAMALLVGVAALAMPELVGGSGRGLRSRVAVAAAVGVPVAAGIAARVAAGGYAYPGALDGDGPRLAWLAAAVALPVVVWIALRRALPADLPSAKCMPVGPRPTKLHLGGLRRHSGLLVAGGLAVLVAAVTLLAPGTSGKWVEPSGGFTHGRAAQWSAAVDTAIDHPVAGAGAGSYAVASRTHQSGTPSIYAHDMPLETGAELGPLGLLLALALYGSVAVLLWRIRRHPAAFLVAPGVIAFLAANLVDWEWHLAASGAVFASLLGACLALAREAAD
jgi:O-Antigen ligase